MEPKEFDFEFPRGDTLPITFDFKDVLGNELTELDEIWFTLKKSYSANDFILQKKLTTGQIEKVDGGFAFEISHKDTASLPYGKYVYDIQIKSGTYYRTAYIGQITLTNEATFISNE